MRWPNLLDWISTSACQLRWIATAWRTCTGWSQAEMMLHLNVMPIRTVAAMFNPRSLTSRAFIIPKGMTLNECNRDDIRVIEMPASNGIGTARSVAKAYGSVATGGSDLGITRRDGP